MTSLFGGVQLFSIIISVIRTKLIAIFIGPAGMGLITLLNSTLNIIGGISGLGIETSAIKNISEKYKDEDLNNISKTVALVKKMMLISGILGTLLTIIFSKWLSIFTFGNTNQVYSFIFLSITLLFKQITSGQLVVLQGLRKLRLLAKANFYGNLFGLLFSIPLYYFLKIDAIVPTILVSSFSALVFSFYFSNQLKIQHKKVENKYFKTEGKVIVKLGIMLTISSLLTLLSSYLIQIYISNVADVEQVGFYNAGFTLLNSYVGIIFTVMSIDYFPRLAALNADNENIKVSVTQQSYISILIITPIIVLFLTFIPLIIRVIYTPTFMIIMPMVCFGILGMLFRAVSWSMGYILIAKGDSKMFIKTAILFNTLSIVLNVLGYYFYGLEGLGISFFVYYSFHFFILKIITKKRYGFYFEKEFYIIYTICFLICFATFLIKSIEFKVLRYSLMSLMCLIALAFALYQINKEMNLKNILIATFRNTTK
ncbi:oligosaccharide flippase family protein [Flavobacterium geliluteum]|uniref:Oligosaccharide flippase family protein n=1 Tax=Flavobacterium geliluteum TaxID=2816120 RepID=A0A940X8Q4_9FLAO|nr:oligosaccharide flippase family protein [Flavobacterium geliluteum]MBP4137567.1 oligosaccharide flippase family protein [Flavobacterium geliluteum]